MPKFLSLLVLWAACAVAQTVEGTVVNDVTGIGIAGVEVILVQSGKTIHTTITDGQGRFRIQEVKSGSYAPGYFLRDYVQEAEAPRPFQVIKAGETSTVDLRMIAP